MEDVCFFAHFDKDNKVDEYVLRYLAKLKELNFSIVFISTTRLAAADIERLGADCADVMLRGNSGLDFGSWAAAFRKHGAAVNGRLLLANDSVYGPIGSLRAALERLTAAPADFYGMVESTQIAPHLQSWFLLFEPWVIRHETFSQVLSLPFPAMAKKQIVAQGEVALSSRLIAQGFRYAALCKRDDLGSAQARHAMNPMLLFWREVLFEYGVPFLKIELLRDNPLGVENVDAILRDAEPIEPGLRGPIEAHLMRIRSADAVRRARRPLPARLRYAAIRKRYRLERQNRRMAAAWTTILLELLTVPIVAWRAVNAISGSRQPGP